MDLQPASLAQLQRAKSGRMVLIEDDVGAVVCQVQEVNPDFHVRYSEEGGYFVIYGIDAAGKEYLVLTAQELDGRVLQRVQEITSEQYSYAQELEAQDDRAQAAKDYAFGQQVGELGEELAHALRKDRGL